MSPNPPRVTVLLSTYNGGKFLANQLDSLRSQENVSLDLYVRDDGSTDDTLRILTRYAHGWPSLSLAGSGANLKAAASFLELLRSAPGNADYYAFCDQDDVWLPGKLARAVATLGVDKGPALYCSNVTCVDANLRVLGVPPDRGDASFRHMLFENIAYGCTTVMNASARALVTSRLPERGIIMHDWWVALVTAAFGTIHYDPQPSILYRQHGTNLAGAETGMLAERMRVLRELATKRSSFSQLHGQAEEFLRLFGEDLDPSQRRDVQRFVNSKHSLSARLAYAAAGPVSRKTLAGELLFRGLIAAGWY